MKRVLALLPVLLALQVGVSPALAWTWPVDGPVLRPFVFDRDIPYAGGQHRGIDVGAPTGTSVLAPAAGIVSFAGTVPGGGLTLAIRTPDGYSVTLVHLGAIAAARGETVAEGVAVGSVGPSGEAEHPEPYVHLGIRMAADPQGYVDPLSFLPARSGAPPAGVSGEAVEAPVTSNAGGTGPAAEEPAGGTPAVDGERTPAASTAAASPSGTTTHIQSGKALARHEGHLARRLEREAVQIAHRPVIGAPLPLAARLLAPDRSLPGIVTSETPAAVGKFPRGPSRVVGALVLLAVSAGAAGLAAGRQLRGKRVARGAAVVLPEARVASIEDANRPPLREKDEQLEHRDLERVLLAQVDVTDDPRRPTLPLRVCGHDTRRWSRSHRRRASARSLV